MPRRMKTIFLMVLILTISFLVYTSHLRRSSPPDTRTFQDFYHKTKEALDRGHGSKPVFDSTSGKVKGQTPLDRDADGDIDADDDAVAKELADRLKKAEQKAKDLANSKAPNKPDAPHAVVGVGSSAVGQKKTDGNDAEGADAGEQETAGDSAVEKELQRIFKKSPVIIFSKSYCPFSKKAKGILLEKYTIDPAPYVVELNEHPLGTAIQDELQKMTGRGTVPNIMVNRNSIGGGDEIVDLDNNKALIDKMTKVGAKKVDIKERFSEKDSTL